MPDGDRFASALASSGVAGAAAPWFTRVNRSIPPAETVARVKKYMPAFGITRIANVTGLNTIGIPVVMVCRPNSRSISVSQGKGPDLDAARASGLMESVESYHAERIVRPLLLGSYEDLRYSHPLIDVANLPRPTDTKFTAYSQLLWIEGRNLFDDAPLWLPYELVHLDYSVPLPSGHGYFAANSNGLASGNRLAEAISHALSEVIERDATTLWHLCDEPAQAATQIDLDTVDDPACRAILARYAAAGVVVGAWETTSDIGLPAFVCRIVQNQGPPACTIRPAAGMGCHMRREVALMRALTEAAQSRLTFISGSRDDKPRDGYAHFLDPETYALWHRVITAPGRRRDFRTIPTWPHDTIEDDVAFALDRLRAVGIEQVAVVDLTKPEFAIPVVRVVVPGLEGIDDSPRFMPGRRARARLDAAGRTVRSAS